jgi:hypothetical protein
VKFFVFGPFLVKFYNNRSQLLNKLFIISQKLAASDFSCQGEPHNYLAFQGSFKFAQMFLPPQFVSIELRINPIFVTTLRSERAGLRIL